MYLLRVVAKICEGAGLTVKVQLGNQEEGGMEEGRGSCVVRFTSPVVVSRGITQQAEYVSHSEA